MNSLKDKLSRVEQALWQASEAVRAVSFRTAGGSWQADLMRTVRLTASGSLALFDQPWIAFQRAAIAAVVVAAVGWLAALVWVPVTDGELAQVAWLQSVAAAGIVE